MVIVACGDRRTLSFPAPYGNFGDGSNSGLLMNSGLNRWRRGWDSDPIHLLKRRKLLILRFAPSVKNAGNAGLRYTAGTRAGRVPRSTVPVPNLS